MKLTINEGLERYFVETNAYNFVAFVDDKKMLIPFLLLMIRMVRNGTNLT